MPWLLAVDEAIDIWSPWGIVAMTLPFVVVVLGRLTGRTFINRKD